MTRLLAILAMGVGLHAAERVVEISGAWRNVKTHRGYARATFSWRGNPQFTRLAGSNPAAPASLLVEVSAYDNAGPQGCVRCCGKWAKFNRTTFRTRPTVGRTVACNFLPLGTKIHIQGVGERIVEDRLSPRFGHRIDLLLSDHETATRWGVRKLKVTIP